MFRLCAALAAVAALLVAGCDSSCAKDCKTGKPCGCSCISKDKTCHKSNDGLEWFEPDADLLDDEVISTGVEP